MGREIKRVPLDFCFPIDASYADAKWDEHRAKCRKPNHDECDIEMEPPKGDGWQLWQTVSDGPVTPVFATADELIAYMCQPDLTPRSYQAPRVQPYPDLPAGKGWRREAAERLVKVTGSQPSFVMYVKDKG